MIHMSTLMIFSFMLHYDENHKMNLHQEKTILKIYWVASEMSKYWLSVPKKSSYIKKPNDRVSRVLLQSNSSWRPGDNQRCTALFQRFDIFLRWFREHEKHQHWSAQFQSWSALIFTSETLVLSAEQRWLGADSALNYSELTPIFADVDENIKMW